MRRRSRLALPALLAASLAACGGDSKDPVGPGNTPEPFLGCTTVQPIALGANVSGALTSTDCMLPDQTFVDFYELRLTSTATVTITMTSASFDAYLLLFNRSGPILIADDDDGAGGFDARIQLNLSAGTYIIGANSWNEGDTGAYQLTVN